MNTLFLVGACLMVAICAIHVFAGSRTDVRRLLASDLPEPAKSTVYYCWHLVSITLAAAAGCYLWSGMVQSEPVPAMLATGLSAAYALLGFLIAAARRRSPLTELPQGLMFAVVTAVGVWGLAG